MRPAIGSDIPWDKAPPMAEKATVDDKGVCRFWLGTQGFALAEGWWAPPHNALATVQLTDVFGGGQEDEIYRRPRPRKRKPEDDPEQLKVDAARWRALISSARIRALGSAGLYADTRYKKHQGFAHLGLELWTEHTDVLAAERETGVLWLTAYADIMRGLPRLPRDKK